MDAVCTLHGSGGFMMRCRNGDALVTLGDPSLPKRGESLWYEDPVALSWLTVSG